MEDKKELQNQDERVVEIELERLRGFVNHPFKVQVDSQMIELQESIKKYGILNPLIVRPRQDGTYEIISDHRRKAGRKGVGINSKIWIGKAVTRACHYANYGGKNDMPTLVFANQSYDCFIEGLKREIQIKLKKKLNRGLHAMGMGEKVFTTRQIL